MAAARRSLVFALTSDAAAGKKPILDATIAIAAIRQVAELARQQGTAVALIGGLAMQRYGSDRLTRDVDVAAARPLDGIVAERSLSFGGIEGRAPNGAPTDIVVRDDEYAALYEEALSSARQVEGLEIPLVSAEHLVAMKMAAGRGKDLSDLEFLVRSGVIDRTLTRDIVRRHLGPYAAREFDLIVAEIEWKVARGLE